MPVLANFGVRECCANLRADYVMARDVKTVRAVESVSNIKKLFEDDTSNHHAFPVVNQKGMLVGIIPRNHMINIIKCKNFYQKDENDYVSHLEPHQ
jgi:CBS-domain-containing membrane protein